MNNFSQQLGIGGVDASDQINPIEEPRFIDKTTDPKTRDAVTDPKARDIATDPMFNEKDTDAKVRDGFTNPWKRDEGAQTKEAEQLVRKITSRSGSHVSSRLGVSRGSRQSRLHRRNPSQLTKQDLQTTENTAPLEVKSRQDSMSTQVMF